MLFTSVAPGMKDVQACCFNEMMDLPLGRFLQNKICRVKLFDVAKWQSIKVEYPEL